MYRIWTLCALFVFWPGTLASQVLHEKIPVINLDSKPTGTPIYLMDGPGPKGTDSLRNSRSNAPGNKEPQYVARRSTQSGQNEPQRDDALTMDRRTQREGLLNYFAVFDPTIAPFKRNDAKDTVLADYRLVVADKQLKRVGLLGERRVAGRELFWGSVQIRAQPGQYIPIPSVSPDSNILTATAEPAAALQFYKDGADNFYVHADHRGVVRLSYLMDARATYFATRVPETIRFADIPQRLLRALPSAIQRRAQRLWPLLGVHRGLSYHRTLTALVLYFRGFTPGTLTTPSSGNLFEDLTRARRGVCRHRSFAFVIAALSLGIPARYVSNEAHVWTEVFLPGKGLGWLRIDLGGGAQGLQVHNATQKVRHQPSRDTLPRPTTYQQSYSGQVTRNRLRRSPGPAGPTQVTGLPKRSRTLQRLQRPLPNLSPIQALIPTRTHLARLSSSVFRGHQLRIRGRVESRGVGLPGMYVQIALWNPMRTKVVALLGLTVTDPQGAIDEQLMIPSRLAAGRYQLVATTIATERHAMSRSR